MVIEVDPVNEATPVFAATYSSPNPDVDEDAAVGTEVVDVCSSNYLSEIYYDYFFAFCFFTFTVANYCNDSMNAWKSSQLGKHGFGSLYVIMMRTYCFDTDFASQMK